MKLVPINVYTAGMKVLLHGDANFEGQVVSFGMNDQGCAVPIMLCGCGVVSSGMALLDERDGRVFDLTSGSVFETADEWHGSILPYDREASLGVATKPGPGRPKRQRRAVGPEPVGPWDITFGGKVYVKASTWHFIDPDDGQILFAFALDGGEDSPKDPRVVKITREQFADRKREGIAIYHSNVVRGLVPDSQTVETMAALVADLPELDEETAGLV